MRPEVGSASSSKTGCGHQERRIRHHSCNCADSDMVGHTGVMETAVQAVEALDHWWKSRESG
ncbi:hypothetical protein ACNKHV_22735 [Shigella flexneri]